MSSWNRTTIFDYYFTVYRTYKQESTRFVSENLQESTCRRKCVRQSIHQYCTCESDEVCKYNHRQDKKLPPNHGRRQLKRREGQVTLLLKKKGKFVKTEQKK